MFSFVACLKGDEVCLHSFTVLPGARLCCGLPSMHMCLPACVFLCVCVCVCASTVALNGFLNITSNDFCSERVSRSAFGGLARSRHRAESAHRHPIPHVCVCVCVFVYSFALEEKSWRHKHGSASPEKVSLTSFSCFLLGCPKHTHTHADYASFPQRHLAACPRMTQHPSGFFFFNTRCF